MRDVFRISRAATVKSATTSRRPVVAENELSIVSGYWVEIGTDVKGRSGG